MLDKYKKSSNIDNYSLEIVQSNLIVCACFVRSSL